MVTIWNYYRTRFIAYFAKNLDKFCTQIIKAVGKRQIHLLRQKGSLFIKPWPFFNIYATKYGFAILNGIFLEAEAIFMYLRYEWTINRDESLKNITMGCTGCQSEQYRYILPRWLSMYTHLPFKPLLSTQAKTSFSLLIFVRSLHIYVTEYSTIYPESNSCLWRIYDRDWPRLF